jgi:hypothetical protein
MSAENQIRAMVGENAPAGTLILCLEKIRVSYVSHTSDRYVICVNLSGDSYLLERRSGVSFPWGMIVRIW